MKKRFARSFRRRGAAIVSTAIVGFPLLLVASALAIDFGKIFGSQGDMQRAADAAALAAAGALSENIADANQLATARLAAQQYVESNTIFGEQLTIDPLVDVVFGSSELSLSTGVYSFAPTENSPNAARVTIRYTANSPNGSAPLLFAKAFGVSSTNL
ncbi:MAG: pilus assembly protein TadG-related protein, partial [Phycisphaerae bacterium]